jgi:hypothetical protein
MSKEILAPLGVVVLGFIWIFWRLEWKLDKMTERWDRLPIAERLGAVIIAVGWTILVELVYWYATYSQD